MIEYDISVISYAYIGTGVDISQPFTYPTPDLLSPPKNKTLYYNIQKQGQFAHELFSWGDSGKVLPGNVLSGYTFDSAHYYNCLGKNLSSNCKTDLASYITYGKALVAIFADENHPKPVLQNSTDSQDYLQYAKFFYFGTKFLNVSTCSIGL